MPRLTHLVTGLGLAAWAASRVPAEAPSNRGCREVSPDRWLCLVLHRDHRIHPLELASGQSLAVRLIQRDADLALKLYGPEGELRVTADSPTDDWGVERAWLVADRADNYLVEVVAPKGTDRWSYQLSLSRSLPASRVDRLRAEGSGLLSAGDGERRAQNGDLQRAEDLYQRAAAVWRAAGESEAEGMSWYRIAQVHRRQARDEDALAALAESSAAFGRAGALRLEAQVHEKRGLLLDHLRRWSEAAEDLSASLAGFTSLGLEADQARLHRALALTDRRLGAFQTALEHFAEAASRQRRVGPPGALSQTLCDQASLYLWLRYLDLAADCLDEAGRLARDSSERAQVLSLRGTMERRRGRLASSETALERALDLRRQAGSKAETAVELNELAQTVAARGDMAKALALADQGIALARESGSGRVQAFPWLTRGQTLDLSGDANGALAAFRKAIELLSEFGDSSDLTSARFGLAHALLTAGRPAKALQQIEPVLAEVEAVRTGLGGRSLGGSFFQDRQRYFDLAVHAWMTLDEAEPGHGHAEQALLVADRGRAWGLRQALALGRERPFDPVDPSVALRLAEVSEELSRLELAVEAGRRHGLSDRRLEALEAQRRQTAMERERLQGQARGSGLPPPALVSLEEVRERLDPGVRILYYSLGEERSTLWSLGRRDLRAYRLPARARIEELARAAHEGLSHAPRGGSPSLGELLAGLSKAILEPAWPTLDANRLLVVADGALHYVPFAALPEPATTSPRPLLERYEVSYVPSLAVLRQLASRPRATGPRGRLAVVADPVFQPAPVSRGSTPPHRIAASLLESAQLTADWLGALPSTRQEAENILERVPLGDRLALLGFDASLENVLSGRLADYAIVHFATHGRISTEHPELSALLLSQVAPDGSIRDGFLWVHRLEGLRLRADLAVLSACRTALGQELRGEGLVGLTQGFLEAGARRVVVSLWDVEDSATAELMDRFYSELLEGRLPPAAALAAAQRSLAADPERFSAADWAAFVVVGDP